MNETTPQESTGEGGSRLIEIGWILNGLTDVADIESARMARKAMLHHLRTWFPAFEWKMPVVKRLDVVQSNREEPVVLLDHGASERELRHWDFALVITAIDLESHYKPYALGIPSRSISVGVISTFRIDPQASKDRPVERRTAILGHRTLSMAMHLFGHLNGLSHDDEPGDFMYSPQDVSDLDRMQDLSTDQREELREELIDVADLRLEERVSQHRPFIFYLRAAWIGRDDILNTVWQARPWQFPLRLSRLTTAALSTLVVILITAEAWQLGMTQKPWILLVFSLLALAGTSFYILKRQRLLVRQSRRQLTEQTAVTNLSVTIIVFLGMLSTYALLFLLTFALGQILFSKELIESWFRIPGGIGMFNYLLLAAFAATLGILIGALGASFEGYLYFRHIAYVDEET